MKKTNILKITNVFAIIFGIFLISKNFNVPVTYADGTVDVSIETKEININDIPADRKVSLAVNLDNDPGVDAICLLMCADGRLGIEEYNWFSSQLYSVNGIEHVSNPHIDFCETFFKDNADNTGIIIYLTYIIPENCRVGDFYEISFSNETFSGDRISYGNTETGWHDGFESFGQLTSGGIRIVGDPPAPEPPVQNDTPVQNNQQEPAAPVLQESAAVQVTSSETTKETTATLSETKATTVSTIITTVKETVTTEETTLVEETVITETETSETQEQKKDNRTLWLLIIAGAAVILGAVIIIIKKEKHKS